MPRRIQIFDTTLRDGEQAPGFAMGRQEKLRIAHALAALGVDVMEAGFAAASPGDADAVRAVACEIEDVEICSLGRTHPGDIEAAARALEPAKRSRIHMILGTSPIHREARLKMDTNAVLKRIEESVGIAKGQFSTVEFCAEDAIRTERPFLREALECAVQVGADVLNVPDTVGYALPDEIGEIFAELVETVERPDHVLFSTHCHNDLGLAAANSLAAVAAGAGQIECTMNGIGERAGNCALEEVVMAMRTRGDRLDFEVGIDTTKLYETSRIVAECTGHAPPPNKAIVGDNAFAHEAGIHQHGVLADRSTYEIMGPEDVGAPTDNLRLGKHSGKHALAARLKALGHDVGHNRLNMLFPKFKALADSRKHVSDADLLALVSADSSEATTGAN